MNATTAILASAKHLDDAEILFASGRCDNSAYLSGYVVECSLKSLLLVDGMPDVKKLGHDLQIQMQQAWQFCLALAPDRRRVTIPSGPDVDALMATWKPDLRYDVPGSMSPAKAGQFLTAARDVFCAISIAQQLDHSSHTKS